MWEYLLELDFRIFLGLVFAAIITLGSLAVWLTDRLDPNS